MKFEDNNVDRAKRAVRNGARNLPGATGRYLLQKVPVLQWLPKYSPRWIINDAIAGLTVGVILVPQALAYAKIAGIPLQDGLLASWLPSVLYFFMGTSKDMNTGPTSIIGLLTAQIIKDIGTEGGYSATAIAVAISFSVGVYCLILGILKLGFLLELVSHPVLTGFISAAAITIILGQIPAIFGEKNIGSGAKNQIHDIFAKLPTTKPITFAIGFSGIVMLVLMQNIGQRWGKKSKVVWIVSIGRNAITILLFTVISYVLNKDIEKPMFDLTGKIPSGLLPPKAPDMALVGKVFQPSLAVFLAAALEHIAIAKTFGRKNNYTIDQSQELTFLGSANMLNSFMGGMSVGGAASRTAVNSESGVKSPMYGIFTAGTVLISIYVMTGALFWIPKATLAAVIITAVYQMIAHPSVFFGYWKVSIIDFCASMIAFWVTLFVSAEMGIELATGFMILSTILQTLFLKGKGVSTDDFHKYYPSGDRGIDYIPAGTAVVKFNHPIIFLNASRAKSSILDSVQTYNTGSPSEFTSPSKNPDRMWSELGARHIDLLRRKANMSRLQEHNLPQIQVVVVDLSGVIYVDETGIVAMKDMKTELKTYGGENVKLRFVGLKQHLLGKFERAGWKFVRSSEENDGDEKQGNGTVVLYHDVREAIADGGRVIHVEEFGTKEAVTYRETRA